MKTDVYNLKVFTSAMHGKSITPQLIILLKAGSVSAFSEIYRALGGKIYNFFKASLSDSYLTEELVQEFFLKVWEKREEIDPTINFEAYLFTIARHMVFKTTKQMLIQRNRQCTLDDALEVSAPSVEQEVEAKLLKQFIDRQVEQLPRMCRTIYTMSRVEQLSRKEIAARLSISERTVDSHLYQALQAIKSKLGNQALLLALAYCCNV